MVITTITTTIATTTTTIIIIVIRELFLIDVMSAVQHVHGGNMCSWVQLNGQALQSVRMNGHALQTVRVLLIATSDKVLVIVKLWGHSVGSRA